MSVQLIKRKILDEIISLKKISLDNAKVASKNISDFSKSDELKQESKYDTRAIEASYIAGAQSKRVKELEAEIKVLMNLNFSQSLKVLAGSIVKVVSNNRIEMLFILPFSSVKAISVDGIEYKLISTLSKFGREIIGLEVGDEFLIELQGHGSVYQILKVL